MFKGFRYSATSRIRIRLNLQHPVLPSRHLLYLLLHPGAVCNEGELMPAVKALYLVYFEPQYKETYEAITDGHTNGEGFDMPFRLFIHKIKRDTKEIDRLLEKASATL